METDTPCLMNSSRQWLRLLRSVYRVDKLRQFFVFLPKEVIDACVEQHHLDKYAKKIRFRPFTAFMVFTFFREKR